MSNNEKMIKRKQELEVKMLKLIEQYNDDTGLSVTDVSVDYTIDDILYDVIVSVELK